MARSTLNLGIVAHVDAGKTTLTERLLYAAGVIDTVGSVDAGTTQTDSADLERERGITIKSSVVSFGIGDTSVNLIDTPGHPDFIAEVERVLGVLDGAVLVVSAVEGVQPETRLLWRALRRLEVPTLIFVNKIDRLGADTERVVAEIRRRLTPDAVPLGDTRHLGTRAAAVEAFSSCDPASAVTLAASLAEHDDSLLDDYVRDPLGLAPERLDEVLAEQTRRGDAFPLLFGSALTGAGLDGIQSALTHLLPAATGSPDAPLQGGVFKIERSAAGEKVAYVRLFAGRLRAREVVVLGTDCDKVTAINVFENGSTVRRGELVAGEIAKVSGLKHARIGDVLGAFADGRGSGRQFGVPTLASVVVARHPSDKIRLSAALEQLGEQDPLINVRRDGTSGEMSVSLFGEVQKEVLQYSLAHEYGVEVSFSEVTAIHVERPRRAAEAVELLHAPSNPFRATLGFRIEPGADGSGLVFRLDVDPRTTPLFLYKTVENFAEHLAGWASDTLAEGLSGWQVTDCIVTLNRCTYSVPDGPPSRSGPLSRPIDFRSLTPLVLMAALDKAKTVVCEPMVLATVEVPRDNLRAIMSALGQAGATVEGSLSRDEYSVVEACLPAARALELQRRLVDLSSGEGLMETRLVGYRAVRGRPPIRRRTTVDPRTD